MKSTARRVLSWGLLLIMVLALAWTIHSTVVFQSVNAELYEFVRNNDSGLPYHMILSAEETAMVNAFFLQRVLMIGLGFAIACFFFTKLKRRLRYFYENRKRNIPEGMHNGFWGGLGW
jgi:hypothetical protein